MPAESAKIDSTKPMTLKPKKTLFEDVRDLVLCTAAIYVCYIIYGVLQEKIQKEPYGPDNKKFRYSLFLVFFQSVINGLVALGVMLYTRQPQSAVPASLYAKIGASYIGAMFASNYSLNFVSYPTQVLAKSCKIIPVMLMNLIMGQHKYHLRDYLGMIGLTIGISMFMLFQAGAKNAGTTSLYGLFSLAVSLALDAYTSPTQEQAMAKYKPTVDQVMFFLNFYAVLLTSLYLVPSGEMLEAFHFLREFPAALLDVTMYSILSALGQYSILVTLFRFNSLALAVITTTRKFFTILISVLWFGHPLTNMQWVGVGFVFFALSLEIDEKYEKNHKKKAGGHTSSNGTKSSGKKTHAT